MPNLGECKIIDDNLYCWDKDRNDFVQVELKLIASPAVYKKVVEAFMADKTDKPKDA